MAIDYPGLSIAFSVVEGLAIILTLFRLGFRLKIQRFWWEDVWAAVALLCTVVSITSVFIVSNSEHHESIVIAGRINEYMLTSIIWSVRMSLIFSIIRITCSALLRRITLAASACFVLFWAATCCLQAWWRTCDSKLSPRAASRTCVVPTFIIIFEVTTNVVADLVTLMLSLKLLWRVKLPRRQCRMILYLFTTSRFLCVFSLAHSIAQLVGSQSTQVILASLQVTAFMVVCNLVVVITYIYRVFWRSHDGDLTTESSSDDDDFTMPSSRRTRSLTTVNLDSAFTGLTGSASDAGSGFYHSTAHATQEESQNRESGYRVGDLDWDLSLLFG